VKEKQQLEHLYNLYRSNKCTAAELEAFFELLDSNDDNEIKALMSATWDSLPLEAKQIKFGTRKKTTWSLRRWTSVAAALLLITGFLYLFKTDMFRIVNPVREQQMLSLAGERKQLQLADGTRVWLSPNSKLNYPDKFYGKQRLISLQGEAFFEVAHDVKHPFIIKTGKVSTTVLGTSFNISAYKNNNTINVTLVTGRVAVALETKNDIKTEVILPNQQIIIDMAGDKLTKINFPGATSFLNKRLGIFEYKGTTLEEVIKDIEAQYNVNIMAENNLSDHAYYGNLNMNDSVEQTLDKLCLVMEATWKINGGQYVIIK